jgi:folate-binding protein YgfZ
MEKRIIKLSDRSILSIGGKDSKSFLQAIITCDVEKISSDPVYGAILTPQGKLLYDFIIFKKNNEFLLDISKLNIKDFKKLLTIYKLRSDISIEERLDLSVFVDIENKTEDIKFLDPRLVEMGSRDILESESLDYGADLILYKNQKIKLGVAETGDDLVVGEIFPMEANLDYLKGIDFQKGCFIGQEVSSRMFRKGTAKKRIVNFTSNDHFTNKEEIVYNGTRIGTVIKKIGANGIALIKVDKISNPDRETTTITTENNQKTMVINLPSFFPKQTGTTQK